VVEIHIARKLKYLLMSEMGQNRQWTRLAGMAGLPPRAEVRLDGQADAI
jgi:hypothetical protein